jgi:uncharacterized protein (TIGR00369 family)
MISSNIGRTPVATAASDTAAEVLRIFAEITRYPADVLEPSADIEEELGIDSVKLGEILSALREQFSLPPTNELRARFPAGQLRTIGGITAAVVSFAGSGARVSAAAATPPDVAPRSPSPSQQRDSVGNNARGNGGSAAAPATSLVDEIRQIFADLTRYPLDILTAEADLEEDLGIDSVKLGELFSVLRERYALPARAELRDRITPAQLRSIGGITEIVRAFGDVPAEASAAAAPASHSAPAAYTPQSTPPRASRPVASAPPTAPRAAAPPVATPAADPRGMAGIEYLRATMRREIPPPPMALLMGLELVEVEQGRTVFEVQPAEQHYNPMGVVHGGLAATILDTAMASAVHTIMRPGTGYATIQLTVNLVNPITAGVGRLRCVGEVVHSGKRIMTAQGRLVDDAGKLYAHATETCVIHGPGGGD